MIVGYNEATLLDACFKSIDFCDEIFYTDLGSTDDSINIALKYTPHILRRDKKSVPFCEKVQSEVVNYLKNDWVIFIDPDEMVDKDLQTQIILNFEKITLNPLIGALYVPWQFYFRRKKLIGTVWGGKNKKYFLVNKKRFDFLTIAHYGRKLKEGFISKEIILNNDETNVLHHYWMSSLKVFLQKHRRYLKNEGNNNYNAGIRVGIKQVTMIPFKEFYNSFINKKGYKDGFTGLFLSSFWAYYKTHIALDILRIQKQKNKQ